jgi:hypothetical protein
MFGRSFQAPALLRQIGLFAAFIPKEVVVAAPPESLTQFANLSTAMLAGWLSLMSEPAEKDEELQRILGERLAALREPQLTAWLRLRDERTAESWFDAVLEAMTPEALDAMGLAEAIEVETEDQQIRLRLRPDAINGGAMRRALAMVGQQEDALAGLAMTATLTQDGDRLALQLGTPKKAPLSRAALDADWQPGPNQLLYGRLDMPDAVELFMAANDLLVDRLDAMDSLPDEDMVRVSELLTRLAELAPRSTTRLALDDGLLWTLVEEFGDEDEIELAAPPAEIVRCLDPKSTSFMLSALQFDMLLVGMWQYLLSETAQRVDRPEFMRLYDWFTVDAQGLMEFVFSDESSVFGPGCAVVASGGRLRTADLGAMKLRDLPFPSYAVLANADDDAAGTAFVDRCTGLLAEALGIESPPQWEDADLGFGVKTRTLPWSGLAEAVGASGLDVDFQPHHVQIGSFLLLSTDPKLTRDLLARQKAAATVESPKDNLIAWSWATGEQYREVTVGAEAWMAQLEGAMGASFPGEEIRAGLRILAGLLGMFESFETTVVFERGAMRDVTHLRLRSGK